jgi:hypothetical protein
MYYVDRGISIHAPTRGATVTRQTPFPAVLLKCFREPSFTTLNISQGTVLKYYVLFQFAYSRIDNFHQRIKTSSGVKLSLVPKCITLRLYLEPKL